MKSFIFTISLLLLLPIMAFAAKPHEYGMVTFINHYSSPITFQGRANAEETLIDFPQKFSIDQKPLVSSRIINGAEAYIRGDDEMNQASVFLGVSFDGLHVNIHGYLSKGIAYSWEKNKGVVTFCTPDDYQKDGYCK